MRLGAWFGMKFYHGVLYRSIVWRWRDIVNRKDLYPFHEMNALGNDMNHVCFE